MLTVAVTCPKTVPDLSEPVKVAVAPLKQEAVTKSEFTLNTLPNGANM